MIYELSTDDLAGMIIDHNSIPAKKYNQSYAKFNRMFEAIVDEFLEREDYDDYLEDILKELIEEGIRFKEVLHFYIRAYLNFNIPRKRFCKKHKSPFEFICDMFFEKTRNAIAFANRTGGKTTNVAILNQLDMAFKPGCEIASAGATKDQATRCYKYFTQFHNRNVYLADLLFKDPTRSNSIYNNESTLEVITGSIKGLNSPHPNKARIDEVELMEWEVLQEGLSMSMTTKSPSTGKEIMSQNCFSCITKDTLIDVPRDKKEHPNGIPLIDLKKQFDKDKDIFVYCFSHRANRFTLKKIKNIWKTKTDEVYKLTYRDVKRKYSLKATKDHLVLLKNGEYKRIDELKKNDSLMCFNRKLKVVSVRYVGIEDVYDIEVEDHHNFVVSGGIVLHNSTRKTESGTMQRLLDMAKKDKRKQGGFQIYEWCIWEVLEKCERECKADVSYGDCPIFDICKGRAKKCGGFYNIDDFIDKCLTLDKDTLDAQWFNLRPSRQILVYGNYWERKKHYILREDFKERIKDKTIHYIGTVDFGSSPGHDFVYKEYCCDVTDFKKEVEESITEDDLIRSKIKYYLVYEYRSGGATTEVHCEKIKNAPHWGNDLPVWADPSAKQERIDMEEIYGISTYEADNAVLAGIEKVRAHLQFGAYFVVEGYLDCQEDLIGTDLEFEKYSYKRFKDGKVNRKEPEQVWDHGMDLDRYAISSSIPYFREAFMPLWEDIEEDDGFWDL